jgi:hypothetical protein
LWDKSLLAGSREPAGQSDEIRASLRTPEETETYTDAGVMRMGTYLLIIDGLMDVC